VNVTKIINKVYPKISKDYSCNSKVEVYKSIFTRLNVIPAMNEDNSCAEYDWNENKIYIYSENSNTEEDIIRALIHECVHSNQSKEIFDEYYECGLDYSTNPCEIEAEYEEENWKKYKLNTIHIG
jgi:hypothetical protein